MNNGCLWRGGDYLQRGTKVLSGGGWKCCIFFFFFFGNVVYFDRGVVYMCRSIKTHQFV